MKARQWDGRTEPAGAPAPASTGSTAAAAPPRAEFALTAFPETILVSLLHHLRFEDFKSLRGVSRTLKRAFDANPAREIILQRFIGGFGYRTLPKTSSVRTSTSSKNRDETITLDLVDLAAFRAGLHLAPAEYAQFASAHARGALPPAILRVCKASTRAWNRVVLRIRSQVDLMPLDPAAVPRYYFPLLAAAPPLLKKGRAPTLKVWVPTKNGSSWMGDDEVVECEREVWRSGVWNHTKRGDVVQNVAVEPFGNIGKLLSDGKFLRDFSFTYDGVGHLPPWFDMLACSPGFYHNVVASSTPNPVFYLCLSAFVSQVREKLTLCNDLVKISSPQGSYSVKRFVYRAGVKVIPGVIVGTSGSVGGSGPGGVDVVHEDWGGQIVVETEGTAEHAAALLALCASQEPTPWRILREKSRPGQMWLRPVMDDERVN
ncbi:F-box domain contaning protein [Pseudohyphozyma bogoriensis]|nr:F-box domain contaning protein [Pseudohyphozyma bogoriensis]